VRSRTCTGLASAISLCVVSFIVLVLTYPCITHTLPDLHLHGTSPHHLYPSRPLMAPHLMPGLSCCHVVRHVHCFQPRQTTSTFRTRSSSYSSCTWP